MGRETEVGLDPCRAEGGCPMFQECKAYRLDCHSFRSYVAGRARIGIDKRAEKEKLSYRYISDRGLRRKRLKEWAKMYAKPWKEPKVSQEAADNPTEPQQENCDE